VPGAIALQRHGGRRSYATADLKTQEPISAGDRFRVGSITKSYVAAVVLQLAAERRLRLDDSVQRWLPGLVPGGAAITVRQLMNHTSGVADYIDLRSTCRSCDPLKAWRPPELVQRAVAHPPLFAPDMGWSYSNPNYVLLGLIVAAADRLPGPLRMAGPALEVYRRIVVPLRLWQTSFPLLDPDIHGPHAHGDVIDPPPEWGLPAILDTTRWNPSVAWDGGSDRLHPRRRRQLPAGLVRGSAAAPRPAARAADDRSCGPRHRLRPGRLSTADALRQRLGA
jgi:D-alanyl-D-alanine carboxypeptidase